VDKIKVIHDTTGHTLTVWFDDPIKEHVCEFYPRRLPARGGHAHRIVVVEGHQLLVPVRHGVRRGFRELL
jgi:hypothetical protein